MASKLSVTAAWQGLLEGKRKKDAELSLTMTLTASQAGGSGAFAGLASDERRYYIKPLNNMQGDRVPVTEQIVGRVGKLIGAPVCDVRTIAISADFAGWRFCEHATLQPGIAHASLEIRSVMVSRHLEHRSDDSNDSRHALITALHDWCWGDDEHWLVSLNEDYSYYSHDHGFFFPGRSAKWDSEALAQNRDAPHVLHDISRPRITDASRWDAAAALRKVTRDQLVEVLSHIPISWPINNTDLEAVGAFLEHRASIVADRMESATVRH